MLSDSHSSLLQSNFPKHFEIFRSASLFFSHQLFTPPLHCSLHSTLNILHILLWYFISVTPGFRSSQTPRSRSLHHCGICQSFLQLLFHTKPHNLEARHSFFFLHRFSAIPHAMGTNTSPCWLLCAMEHLLQYLNSHHDLNFHVMSIHTFSSTVTFLTAFALRIHFWYTRKNLLLRVKDVSQIQALAPHRPQSAANL